jgi:potassium/hydrogen antiporter
MFPVDRLILLAAVLLLIGVTSSKFSSRFGVPVLILFLGLGMLAGSEGLAGIAFDDHALAHGIGTIALALILFDGGLSTPFSSLRRAWRPAFSLATTGVLVTALITGGAASWLLGLPLLEGMLLGSIVGSTDAAAMFAMLRGRGLHLPRRLNATLEVESGSNDPMAVFLTVGLIQLLTGGFSSGWELLGFFVLQMGVGAAVGIGVGRGAVHLVNRINLDAAGLYPILAAGCGLLAYGLAAALGGSGFLAVYLAGIVLGNRRVVFQRGILLFHDGTAWLSQIGMFVILGLLSVPSRLLEAAFPGMIIALVLLVVARPAAVLMSLLPFRFPLHEMAFVSWAGLRGAVPIILATYPLLAGVPNAPVVFDVVFFAVVVSVLAQGLTLPWAAHRLGVEVPRGPEPPVMLEITSLKHVDSDIVDYAVGEDSRAAGRQVRALALPEVAVIAMIARGREVIPPRGSTRIRAGDHVFVVLRPHVRSVVDRIFARGSAAQQKLPELLEFPLQAATTAGDISDFYGVDLGVPRHCTLGALLADRLGTGGMATGSAVDVAGVRLVVRRIEDGRIDQVTLAIRSTAE